MTALVVAFHYCGFGVACNTADGGVSELVVVVVLIMVVLVVGVVAFSSQLIERFCNDSIVLDSVDSVEG